MNYHYYRISHFSYVKPTLSLSKFVKIGKYIHRKGDIIKSYYNIVSIISFTLLV